MKQNCTFVLKQKKEKSYRSTPVWRLWWYYSTFRSSVSGRHRQLIHENENTINLPNLLKKSSTAPFKWSLLLSISTIRKLPIANSFIRCNFNSLTWSLSTRVWGHKQWTRPKGNICAFVALLGKTTTCTVLLKSSQKCNLEIFFWCPQK